MLPAHSILFASFISMFQGSSAILCSNTSTLPWVTLTPFCCLDTNTITTTCTIHGGYALVWSVGQEVKSFQLGGGVGVVHFKVTTSGLNCTAYKVWVDVANGTILSNITCTGLGGLSKPLHISCKSDDDRAGVCTAELGNASCATPTSVPSTVTTPPDSLNTGAIVGCVVGTAIVAFIVVIVTVTICRECCGRRVNLESTSVSGHDVSKNAAGPTRLTVGRLHVSPATAVLREGGDDVSDKHNETETAVKPYIEGTENQNTSTVLKHDDSAGTGTGDGHHAPKPGDPSDPAPKPGDPSDPAPKPGDPSDPAPKPGDPSDPAPKPGDPSDPALETERFTANGEECTQVTVKTECVFSRGPANKNTPSGTTAIQDTGHSDILLYTEVPKAIGSQPNPPYETNTMQVCVVIEPKRKIDGVNCV